jgi:hypothetical protein
MKSNICLSQISYDVAWGDNDAPSVPAAADATADVEDEEVDPESANHSSFSHRRANSTL